MSTVIIAAWRKSLSRCNEPTGSCSLLITSILKAIITRYDLSYQQNGRQPLSGKGKKKRGVEARSKLNQQTVYISTVAIFFYQPRFHLRPPLLSPSPSACWDMGGGHPSPSLDMKPGTRGGGRRGHKRQTTRRHRSMGQETFGAREHCSRCGMNRLIAPACREVERSHGEGGWRSSNNCTLALLREAAYKPSANVAGFCGSCVDARSSTC